MSKRLLSLLLALCLTCCLLAACGKKPEITSEEAYQLVLDALGDDAANAQSPHIHTGEYYTVDCYNIYVTVGGESLVYVVSKTGDILYSGHATHSH